MSGQGSRLLVVEDDESIGSHLVQALAGQAYEVEWAKTAAQARHIASRGDLDLILLDLGLPDLDGVVLCRELRRLVPPAVIVALTARDTEVDVVVTLEAGADDYILKPFRLAELLARIRAHLRRSVPAPPDMTENEKPATRYVVGNVELDLTAHRCLVNKKPVPLRPKEFELLEVLLSEAGRAISRESLMERVWGSDWFGSTKTLDMHIAMLRRRLVEGGEQPERITTLRGYGYRYESVT